MADKYLIGAPVQGQNKPTPLREGDNILNAHLLPREPISLEDIVDYYRLRCFLGIEPGYVVTIDTNNPGSTNNDQMLIFAYGDYRIEAYQNGVLVETYEGLSDTETLTLPEPGVYDLRILPIGDTPITSMLWNGSSDRRKVTKVLSIGRSIDWQNLSHWGCDNLISVKSGLNTSSVTNMTNLFRDCSSLTYVDLSGLDTSSLVRMDNLFRDCSSLTSVNLSGLDTSSATTMTSMFQGCSSLTSVDLSGFNTSSVKSMSSMFQGCSSLISVDLSSFDTSSVTNMYGMFSGAKTEGVIGIDEFNISSLSTGSFEGAFNMFTDTYLPTSVYDNLLINWNAQGRSNIRLGAGSSKYTPGGDAESARDNMIANGWTITDGGPA